MNKDLTTGKPEKVLWQFCLPLFGSIIFQQLYNIADSFVAGKFISDNALAAVGNSYEITLIFIAFAFGCNIACSVLAALFFGAKQYNDLKTTVYTALISSCVICAVLMLVGTLCCDAQGRDEGYSSQPAAQGCGTVERISAPDKRRDALYGALSGGMRPDAGGGAKASVGSYGP